MMITKKAANMPAEPDEPAKTSHGAQVLTNIADVM
jgi:hypothetical protein